MFRPSFKKPYSNMDSDPNGYLEYPRGGEESVEIAHYSFQIGRNGGSAQSFNEHLKSYAKIYYRIFE